MQKVKGRIPPPRPPPAVATGPEQTPADDNSDAEALAVMFPGEVLELDLGNGLVGRVRVLPLGFRHLRTFASQITSALSVVGNMQLPAGDDPAKMGKAIMMTAAPLLMGDLFVLLKECVVVESPPNMSLDDLPHWLVPDIVSAWIEMSFGDEKKWRPWIAAIDKAMTALTREPFSILETVRSAVSAPDTPGTK